MVALAYEWGSANHMAPKDTSPDDLANLDMAIFMKAFGGQFKKEKPYPSERFVSGHIPRNVRLSLAAIDLVEPYVCMSGHYYHGARPAAIATSAAALDSATPAKKRTSEGDAPPQSNSNNMDSNPNPNPKNSSRTVNLTLLHFEWYVGGATKVDSTFLTWHIPSSAEVGVTLSAEMEALFDTVTLTEQGEKLKASKVRSTKALLQYYRNLGRRRARSGPRSLLNFFPVVATFPMSGRSRWYHGSEQPDPPSSSSP
eukprot:gene31616-41049_t